MVLAYNDAAPLITELLNKEVTRGRTVMIENEGLRIQHHVRQHLRDARGQPDDLVLRSV